MPSSRAAASRPCPAITLRSASTSTGTLKPKALMLFAICRICFLLWRRSVDLSAVDELSVGDGWPGGGSAEQEIGQIGDAPAAIEAVVTLARIARQMLGADAVEGAVEPGLHVAEQDMDDGQHGIGVCAAVLDDRVVAEAVGEAVVALQAIGDDAGAGLGCAADKGAQIR